MGFEVVCLGKGKNNLIDLDATPESCAEEAASKGMNPKMLAAFKDGTKTMVEMAAVVERNRTCCRTCPGCTGRTLTSPISRACSFRRSDGGILTRRGCVDYSTGPIAPGVFAIVYSDNPRIRKDMKFITRADGPYYLHFRPYHLCDLETPQSIAEAVLFGEVTVAAGGRQRRGRLRRQARHPRRRDGRRHRRTRTSSVGSTRTSSSSGSGSCRSASPRAASRSRTFPRDRRMTEGPSRWTPRPSWPSSDGRRTRCREGGPRARPDGLRGGRDGDPRLPDPTDCSCACSPAACAGRTCGRCATATTGCPFRS